MKMRYLPGTQTLVSELSLGTMTFGEQVGKEDSLNLLDQAVYDYGINFVFYAFVNGKHMCVHDFFTGLW